MKIIYDSKSEDDTRKAYEAVRILTENGFYGIEASEYFETNKNKWDKGQDDKLKKILKIKEEEIDKTIKAAK